MKPKEEGLLVKSCRKSSWRDKSSGKEMTKHDRKHPQFSEKCLKAFDAEIYDGPGESLNYQIITIDNRKSQYLSKGVLDILLKLRAQYSR